MEIHFLADRPDHVRTVVNWIYAEWGRQSLESSVEKIANRFQGHLNHNAIPLTLIAMEGDQPVGTASLTHTDLPSRVDLTPWLAAVYVTPTARRHGAGSSLVAAVEDTAARLGQPHLYLFTPDRESFYARLGWTTIDQAEHRGQAVVIMKKDLQI